MECRWVQDMIDRIALYGKHSKGITRLAYSEQDLLARQFVAELMRDAGLELRTDSAGNLIGRMQGTDPAAPAILTGSHLDTAPGDGRYNGVVGVVGALAALKRITQNGAITHPIEIIVFAGEEPSRFGVASIGSKCMAGLQNAKAWSRAKDRHNISLVEALQATGLDFAKLPEASRSSGEVKAFLELHVEQGRKLERNGSQIGIVEEIASPMRLKFKIEGLPAHSVLTPMDERCDALVSASMMVLAIQQIAQEQSYIGTTATVTGLKVLPGVMNVIPSATEMWADVMSDSYESTIEALQEIKDAVMTIADNQGTPVTIEVLHSERPVALDPAMADVMETICRRMNLRYETLSARSVYSAMSMAHLAPTGLILLPCRDGISYHPDEYVDPEVLAAGIDVLSETLYELAK